jgi:hypothetical protein
VSTPGRIIQRAAGRPLARPSRQTFLDAARRGAHAARHSRFASKRATGDVFDLDIHVAVVADVREQLARRGLSLVDWTLSETSWVVGRDRDPVAVVNEHTWYSFGRRMAARFRRTYGSYLRSFHGFVATYPPAFALLYEGLGRPVLAIAATRYEWPFTHYGPSWDWLDDGLRRGVEEGWLTLGANNLADRDYLASYTGLAATHVPSACSYTGLTYTGRQQQTLIHTRPALAEEIAAQLRQRAAPIHHELSAGYAQADLYDRRSLVFIPYNVSIMALSEHYSACMPIYVPDRAFLKQLMKEYPREVLSSLSFCQVTGRPPAPRPGRPDLNDVRDPQVVDWYLDRADFYDTDWMPHIRQFESWPHLEHLLATDDPRAISEVMQRERPERLRRIDELWTGLPWLASLERRQASREAEHRPD